MQGTDMKKTILLVDDRPDMIETLADILDDYGYSVMSAHDGNDALAQIREVHVDLALIDIMMPGINGVETFKKIKKLSPKTAVIMMTAFAVEELMREAMREGAYSMIHKPFDIPIMVKKIEDCFSGPIVLIVDDQAHLADNFSDILTHRGFKVTTVDNGQSAIGKVREQRYDVILLDVVMPGLNGEETFLQIKKINPKATVIMYSGHSVEEIIERCLDNGAYACLRKPIGPAEIIKIIEGITARENSSSNN